MAKVLSDTDAGLLDAYWRAANYLSVGAGGHQGASRCGDYPYARGASRLDERRPCGGRTAGADRRLSGRARRHLLDPARARHRRRGRRGGPRGLRRSVSRGGARRPARARRAPKAPTPRTPTWTSRAGSAPNRSASGDRRRSTLRARWTKQLARIMQRSDDIGGTLLISEESGRVDSAPALSLSFGWRRFAG